MTEGGAMLTGRSAKLLKVDCGALARLELSQGRYVTDGTGAVIGVRHEPSPARRTARGGGVDGLE
jgi:hypothetical protein